ncbi:D-2-hydroxyacid dehydrogenase [Bordetella genomosp. 4]|uniref:D-2-hydroxyacid dehydrogenase n=1 Tax=Bordetella genomosp. 4 TaxID=463044 RepID=UPI000B9ECA26|nr:D-2-hydroxyacid dehydrogenase [Bordetella genomosp. 4]OZI45250.1 hydroxyacid dehydrogenase [Bordetella genomosp. 4]
MTENSPLHILCSEKEAPLLAPQLGSLGRAIALCHPGDSQAAQAEVAFISRDITGRSTKFEIMPETERFYDAMRAAPNMQWLHVHSAGIDRDFYQEQQQRGVRVTASHGASDAVVAQAALTGLLALARKLPQLMRAQQQHKWEPLFGEHTPRDLQGQCAVIVGWGGIGQRIGQLLQALGLKVCVARHGGEPAGPDLRTVRYDGLRDILPEASWLILACPLTDTTRGLISAELLAMLPAHACLINVARGHVVDEPALIQALQSNRLAGAFLDVFYHEPLPAESPIWDLQNVIASPHSAGFSDGNPARVRQIFIDKLQRWIQGTL